MSTNIEIFNLIKKCLKRGMLHSVWRVFSIELNHYLIEGDGLVIVSFI